MFVSGNAVDYFFKQKVAVTKAGYAPAAIKTIANDGHALPPALRFMAPGPGTVAALIAAGVAAGQIDAPQADAAQFDSEALWAVVGQRDWRGRRVLVVRGEGQEAGGVSSGRDWIARQWEAAGAQVDFVGVYQRRAPVLTEAQIQRARAASSDGSVWLFSSSEAVANLAGLPALAGVDWRRARAIATHPRIEEAVRAAGWGVVVASRPALKDIRDTLASIESLYP
jgi:uroporphyrinogen-III synthase